MNISKLKSIEELAKDSGFELMDLFNEDVVAIEINNTVVELTEQLEKLRELAIKDYVDSLEPIGTLEKEGFHSNNWTNIDDDTCIHLYDLSDVRNNVVEEN